MKAASPIRPKTSKRPQKAGLAAGNRLYLKGRDKIVEESRMIGGVWSIIGVVCLGLVAAVIVASPAEAGNALNKIKLKAWKRSHLASLPAERLTTTAGGVVRSQSNSDILWRIEQNEIARSQFEAMMRSGQSFMVQRGMSPLEASGLLDGQLRRIHGGYGRSTSWRVGYQFPRGSLEGFPYQAAWATMEGYATDGVAAQLVSERLGRRVKATDALQLLDGNERAARGVIATFSPNAPAFPDLLTRAHGPVVRIDSRIESALSGLSLTGPVRPGDFSMLIRNGAYDPDTWEELLKRALAR